MAWRFGRWLSSLVSSVLRVGVRPYCALSSFGDDDVDDDDDECPSVAIVAQETSERFSPQAPNTAYLLPNYSTSLVSHMAGYAEYDAGADMQQVDRERAVESNDAEAGRERARPGVDPGMRPPPCGGHFEIHLQFKNGMWWAMPRDLSERLLELWRDGDTQCAYAWDWQGARLGSYVDPDGEATSYNRYVIDFAAMLQRNTDNNRTRAIKIVQVLASGPDTE